MQFRLAGYSSGSRFVLVDDNSICPDGMLFIREIGQKYTTSVPVAVLALQPNDVLYVNSLGRVSRVYESNTHAIDFMMTSHCNSNCMMCPLSEDVRKMDEHGYLEWLLDLIDILPNDIEHICITGGEPTLIGDKLFNILKRITTKFSKAEYQLLTNGRSCANSEFCKRLVCAMPENTLFGIPLHAGNRELYDEIAQTNCGFDQAVQGIKNLMHYGAHVEIRIVVSKLNANYMDELAAFIAENLASVFCVTFMGIETLGNAIKNYDRVWIDYNVAACLFENAIEFLVSNGIDVMLFNYPLCCIKEKYWLLTRRSITEKKVRYYARCEECTVKESCSGFFESTFNVAKPIAIPVVNHYA